MPSSARARPCWSSPSGCNSPSQVSLCFALIGCSAWLNLLLAFRYPATHRLPPLAALAILTFDALQLGGLLYMTGGLTNPFALLMTVPVIISATSLPLRWTAMLGALVIAMATALVFFHHPLPWFPGTELTMPIIYVAGIWMAIVSCLAFTAFYAYRVAEEARLLATALAATELVLQREQHLSALDGLAAAAAHELGTPLATIALVAKEMERALGDDPRYGEDVTLLRSQSERCRAILKQLTSLSSQGEAHMARLPFTSLIEEVIAPHRDFGIAIQLEPGTARAPSRSAGAIPASSTVSAISSRTRSTSPAKPSRSPGAGTCTTVCARNPRRWEGFPAEILDRIGEPYMSKRIRRFGRRRAGPWPLHRQDTSRTLRGTVRFGNAATPGQGAIVRVSGRARSWTRMRREQRLDEPETLEKAAILPK